MIINIVIIAILFLTLQKSPRKNFEIEKSVMKPQMIDPTIGSFSTHYRKYFGHETSRPEDQAGDALFRAFERSTKLYGLHFYRQHFEHYNRNGWNAYSFIPSRKENLYRCYVLTFDRHNAWSLLVVNALLDEFFGKNSNLGLSLLLVGLDGRFAGYNIAVQYFLNSLFSRDSLAPGCIFARDGINFEIVTNKGGFSEINYFHSEIKSGQSRTNV